MNVVDYESEADFRLTTELELLINFADQKYFRFTMASKNSGLGYHAETADNIGSEDYVIRLNKLSNIVISSQVYSSIHGNEIGVTQGLTGTTLTLT